MRGISRTILIEVEARVANSGILKHYGKSSGVNLYHYGGCSGANVLSYVSSTGSKICLPLCSADLAREVTT